MELVKGIPITEYCDTHKLTTRQRLELLVIICDAVQHAHQKGIIHRDLKPGNLLVELHDVRPVPKVVDFGIAKSTNQRLTEHTLCTNFSQMIGTPLYMSPEQAQLSGLDIDTRSDVYSLGVLLYELITGTTPFTKDAMSKIGYDEMRRKIQHDDPPRPSDRISTLNAEALTTLTINQRVDTRKLQQQVRNELDWVVMKALDKDRTRRYQSATAFAEDIQRYLNDEPVQACPPSFSYRLQKTARRFRAPIVTAAVMLLTLLGSTAFSIRYAIFADHASQVAEARRKDTEEQRSIAEHERKEAETQRYEAQRLQAEAVLQSETIRKNLYVADMRLSAHDLKSENIARLHTKLQEQVPLLGKTDYRKWEWYYFQAAGRMNEKSLRGHAKTVEDVAWSPNGKFIGTAGQDGTIIWNATTGKLEKRFPSAVQRGVAWSPDSTHLAWGGSSPECAVRIWNSLTEEMQVLLGHTYSVVCTAWSPDGRRLASAAHDGTCRIWDVATNQCILKIDYETGIGTSVSVAWHPEGKLIATSNVNGKCGLRVWNSVDGSLIQDFDQAKECISLSFTIDGAFLIAVDKLGQCYVIDSENWEITTKFPVHSGECQNVATFGNSKFATCGSDGVVKVWSLPECNNLQTLYGHESAVTAVCWDPSGNILASASSDKSVKIWSLVNPSAFNQITLTPFPAYDVTVQKDNSHVEVILQSQDKKILNLTTAKTIDDGIEKSVFDLRFVLVETDLDALVMRAHRELFRERLDLLTNFKQPVFPTSKAPQMYSVAWSPDRTCVAFKKTREFGNQCEIGVWNIVQQKQVCTWRVETGDEGQLKWSPDSRTLGFAGPTVFDENEVRKLLTTHVVTILDPNSGRIVHRLHHGDLIQCTTAIEWDRSGKRFASGGQFGDVFRWDAETGMQQSSGQIFRVPITSMAWSPDLSRLAVAGENAFVKIVDPESCEEVIELNDSNSAVTRLSWSPDGRKLLGINKEGEIVVWDATRGYEYEQSEDYRSGKLHEKLTKSKEVLFNLNWTLRYR